MKKKDIEKLISQEIQNSCPNKASNITGYTKPTKEKQTFNLDSYNFAGGFYGAQGRVIRLAVQDSELNSKIDSFNYKNLRPTNLEMETAAIYGLSKLLSHHSLSLNAIIANRANGTFSSDPYAVVENLIQYTLEKISQ